MNRYARHSPSIAMSRQPASPDGHGPRDAEWRLNRRGAETRPASVARACRGWLAEDASRSSVGGAVRDRASLRRMEHPWCVRSHPHPTSSCGRTLRPASTGPSSKLDRAPIRLRRVLRRDELQDANHPRPDDTRDADTRAHRSATRTRCASRIRRPHAMHTGRPRTYRGSRTYMHCTRIARTSLRTLLAEHDAPRSPPAEEAVNLRHATPTVRPYARRPTNAYYTHRPPAAIAPRRPPVTTRGASHRRRRLSPRHARAGAARRRSPRRTSRRG